MSGGATLGPPSYKKSLHAAERDTPRIQQARADDRQLMAGLAGHRLKCVDESGVDLAMTCVYGRAPCGARVIGRVPQNDGSHVTMLGWLGTHGLQAGMTVEGATDAEVFRTSVKRVLGPTWRPGDIVVMDHLRAQKAVGGQQALARRGARRLYLPPYSPDLSPIEPCWSKVKTVLRKAKARTRQALDNEMAHAIATVTRIDAQSWLMPCGDALR